MKQKLLKTMLLLCALVVGTSSVWAIDYEEAYTFQTEQSSGNTAYGSNYNVTIDKISWNVPGNQNFDGYVRIGGKNLSGVNRVIKSNGTVSDDICKITFNHNGISNANLTVNSVTLTVASNSDFSTVIEEISKTPSFSVSTAGSFNFVAGDNDAKVTSWGENRYYKFTINVTNSKNSNYGLDVTSIVFYTGVESSDPSSAVTFTNASPSLDLKDALTYTQLATTADGYAGTDGASVTYEITANTAGATINASTGVVSPTQAGSVTVKATAAAVPGYFSSSSASYTLAVSDSRAPAGLAWSAASADVTYDSDSNVFPTLTNPNGVTVSYSSSNTAAATINATTGVITLKNVNANTTIKATFAGNATYKPQEASYTLNVAKAPFAVKDGVFDFVSAAAQEPLEDYGSGMTLTTSAYTTTDKTWTAGNVTMVTSKGSGSGLRWWETDGTLRFYNGAKATFSVPSGYYITKIVTTGANFNSANVGTLSGATWTGVSNEVELSVDGTRNIKTITVTYVSETQTVTLNTYGYATYACPGPLDFTDSETDGYSAWQITDVNSSTGAITFTQITDAVKAGTGVLLKGTASSSINIPVVASGTDISGTNKLVGITTAKDVTTNQYFGLKGDKFVPVNAGTVPAGKALLPYIAKEVGVNAFTFIFEDATGIRTVEKVSAAEAKAIFNLAGQRIQKPQKGINIINGRKVIVK